MILYTTILRNCNSIQRPLEPSSRILYMNLLYSRTLTPAQCSNVVHCHTRALSSVFRLYTTPKRSVENIRIVSL